MAQKIIKIVDGNLEIWIDGELKTTLIEPMEWCYGTERMQELFEYLEINDVKVEEV